MANEEGQEKKPKIVLKRTCPNCEAKVPTDQTRCPECGENILMAKQNKAAEEFGGDAFTPEKAALNMGVAGGARRTAARPRHALPAGARAPRVR